MAHSKALRNTKRIKELYGLNGDPTTHIRTAQRPIHKQVLMYIFSDNQGYGNGQRLADYIKLHKLGDIEETKEVENPNSKNTIKTWIWAIDKNNLKKHKTT